MATRLPNYQMRDGRTRLGQSYFNPIWADLDSRLDALERIRIDWNDQVAQLRDLGLQRIDEYIRPVVEEVNAILDQARDDTDGLAAALVDEHIMPLVGQVNAILQQAQTDTDGLAQALVDEHIAPILAQAQQLLSDIQGLKQTAQGYVDALAEYPEEHLLDQLREVDGEGSGLDADLFQGLAPADFQRAILTNADGSGITLNDAGASSKRTAVYAGGGSGAVNFPGGGEYWPMLQLYRSSSDRRAQLFITNSEVFCRGATANSWHATMTMLHDQHRAPVRTYDLNGGGGAVTSTLDLSAQQSFRVIANTNRTLTFANEPGASRAMVVVVNVYGDTGSITWPADISWSGGSAPDLLATRTTVTLLWDGDNWTGFVSGGID